MRPVIKGATRSRLLVVDASLLRAAGSEGATHPVSTCSRQVLTEILDICHRVAISPAIKLEWDNHQSRFSRLWLVQMYSRRKVIACALVRDCRHIRQAIKRRRNLTERQKEDADKDFLLVEMALNCDHIIISIDDRARGIYHEACRQLSDLSDITWANPLDDFMSFISFLRGDAPTKPSWQLKSD